MRIDLLIMWSCGFVAGIALAALIFVWLTEGAIVRHRRSPTIWIVDKLLGLLSS